nr:hypothetical protein [Tanacetum cinerariifolium]
MEIPYSYYFAMRVNTPRSGKDSLKLNELELCTKLQQRVLDLETTKTTQALEIDSLKRRVKRLKRRKRSRTYGLKRLYKVVLSARVESSEDEGLGKEDGSKQRRIADIDANKDITLAKAKGIVFHEPEEFTTTTTTTTTTIPKLKSHDKGKAKMIKEPVKLKNEDQIQFDEEVALKLQAKLQAKFEKEQRLRTEKKRNKPPTQAQQRKIMCNYLKNIEGKKLIGLKNKSFKSIKKMFDRAFKRVNTFVDFRTELVEESSKKAEAKVIEGCSKRARSELEQENEEGVAIDVIPLAVKPLSIVDWKFQKEGKKSYYKIIRADGSSKIYLIFSHMLKDFNREDVETLWKLVKAKYGSTRPEGKYERVPWGDLKWRIVRIKSLHEVTTVKVRVTAAHDAVTKDDDDDVDDDKVASESEKTDSNKDVNPSINQNDNEEEEYEEDDAVTKDDDDDDVDDDKVASESEKTDSNEDTEVPLQSSSVSSNFANQFLNLDNVSPTDTKVVSIMNVKVRYEEPSTQTLPFLNIHVTVIPKTSTKTGSTILPTISPITHIPQQSTPTQTTAIVVTSIHALLDLSSLFGFYYRVSALEKELSQLKQADYSLQLLEMIKSYTVEFAKKAKNKRKRYIDLVEKSVKEIIKDEVKSQLPEILPKEVSDYATPMIQSIITESLEIIVLAKSSSQPKSTYKAAASLIEFELKNILLDNIQKSKSIQGAQEHKDLYDALVKYYKLDKDLFESYGKVYLLKRDREDKDKDEDPLAGLDQGFKKQKTSNDTEPSRGYKSKELK